MFLLLVRLSSSSDGLLHGVVVDVARSGRELLKGVPFGGAVVFLGSWTVGWGDWSMLRGVGRKLMKSVLGFGRFFSSFR